MITNISIKNFRSIQDTEVILTPLVTIVGANSTGKSNLIKALDFISDVVEYGLTEAVYNRGGFDELLPKQYKNLRGKEVSFKVCLKLGTPKEWPDEFGTLEAHYALSIKKNKKGELQINNESLEIKSLLLLSYFSEIISNARKNENESKITIEIEDDNFSILKDSSFKIYRNQKKELTYSTNIDFNSEQNLRLLINWFGLKGFYKDDKQTPKQFKSLLATLLKTVRPGTSSKTLPIISLERPLINFNLHLRRLITELESISRYDLFINELRQEQAVSNSEKVSTTGDNIPSVVKKFIKENKKSWDRIITTMSNISPYFSNAYSERLRAGKEYIIFEEIFNERKIESWDSSDGTLRALAILLCLESHNEGSTLLIEEPEHGLHPWAIKDLLKHIRETIQQKNIQVILTTHSQQVLECIYPNELLVTERDYNGTHYQKIDQWINIEKISMGEIGQLWTKGLLKGVPTSC